MTEGEIRAELDAHLEYRKRLKEELESNVQKIRNGIGEHFDPDAKYADVHILKLIDVWFEYLRLVKPVDERIEVLIRRYFAGEEE